MNSIKFAVFACLIASAIAAPTETPAGQDSAETGSPSSTETIATTTLAIAPTSTSATTSTQASSSQSASAPSTDDSARDQNATSPMTPSQDLQASASSFTCYDRAVGYYADVEQDCKVYHFCLMGEYNGEPVFQRISYLCLNNTVFDQQALDCVEASKVTAPCKDSADHYETSNTILRQSIVGQKDKTQTDTATDTTASS